MIKKIKYGFAVNLSDLAEKLNEIIDLVNHHDKCIDLTARAIKPNRKELSGYWMNGIFHPQPEPLGRRTYQAQGLYDALKRLINQVHIKGVVSTIHTDMIHCGEPGYLLCAWHEAEKALEDCEELDGRHRTEGGP